MSRKKAPSEETTETAAAKPAGDGMNGDNLIPLHCILRGYATAMRNSEIIWMFYLSNTPQVDGSRYDNLHQAQ